MKNSIEKIDELINLKEWKTKKQINKELRLYSVQINERLFRKQVEKHNDMYFAHEKPYFVAHSARGYKITTDTEEIRKSLRDSLKRGLDQLSKYHKGIKALGENANFNLSIKDNELVFVEE